MNILTTYQECADKLAELLEAAHDAIQSKDYETKRKAMCALNDFIDICGTPVKGKELDDIASQAGGNIFEATLEQAMQEISSRTSELAALTKEVNAIADHMNDASSATRLEQVRAVTNAASQALETVNALKIQLAATQPDQQKVADNIGSLLDILQKVYNQAGNLKN